LRSSLPWREALREMAWVVLVAGLLGALALILAGLFEES
jgi:hypothetical protein